MITFYKWPKTASYCFRSWFYLLLWISACSDGLAEKNLARLSGATMGTTYHISIVTEQAIDIEPLQVMVDQRLVELNQSMSTYIADSEINGLNRAQVNQWHDVSDDFYKVLRASDEVSRLSANAFDVTLRPLIDLWGFGPKNTDDMVPTQPEISAALEQIGWSSVELSDERPQLRMLKPVTLDLSAVAKGFAVDEIALLIERQGYTDYLVEIGGEIKLSGSNANGGLWRIAIERPEAELAQKVYKILPVSDQAIATSGDYRNYFERDGVRYSHTIDPRTGRPITHSLASVTVLHDSSAMADALATAFNVMGLDAAMDVANKEGVAAYFISKDESGFVDSASEAFQPYLQRFVAD